MPWDEDDATMKGEDDGGKDYELPKGYELSAEDGVPVILNPDGQPCGLQGHNGCPLLIDEAKKRVAAALGSCSEHHIHDWGTLKTRIKDELSRFLYERTRRSPMILPILMEV